MEWGYSHALLLHYRLKCRNFEVKLFDIGVYINSILG